MSVESESGRQSDVQAAAPEPKSRAATTVRNVAWLGGTQAIRQIISILTMIVLARFLKPADFGVFAMTILINELAQLFVDFGIGSALVQRKQVDQLMLSTCFWINVLVGLVAALAIVASGPLASAYFGMPMLEQLLRMSALSMLLSALCVIPQAVLSRRLDFQHIALGTTIGSLVGAVCTIVLAALGAGVWALAAQPVIGTTVNLIYLILRSRWWPSARVDFGSVKGVLSFSGNLLFSNAINHLARNLQHLILGPTLGAAAVGLMVMAATIAWLPVAQFSSAAVRAVFPVFAQIQDSRGRIEAGLVRAIELVVFLAYPTLVGVAVLAPDFLPVVFGKQWADCGPLVFAFSGLSMVQCVSLLAGSTTLATGRADLTMKLSLVSLAIVGSTLLLLRSTTLNAAALGFVLSSAGAALLGLWIALRNISARWQSIWSVIWRPALLSFAMGALLWLARLALIDWLPALRLVVLSIAGAAIYLSASWAMNRATMLSLRALILKR